MKQIASPLQSSFVACGRKSAGMGSKFSISETSKGSCVRKGTMVHENANAEDAKTSRRPAKLKRTGEGQQGVKLVERKRLNTIW